MCHMSMASFMSVPGPNCIKYLKISAWGWGEREREIALIIRYFMQPVPGLQGFVLRAFVLNLVLDQSHH